ncbi:MAG: hypothetical protein ACE5F2_02450, partial [Candidatus Paceibacteria bacterium]
MDKEFLFNNKKYISSKTAGKISGYTNDYVARLARQGKVSGRIVGRTWYVEEESLNDFVEHNRLQKEQLHEKLSSKRVQDYRYSKDDRKIKERVGSIVSGISKAPRIFKYEFAKKIVAVVVAVTVVSGGYFIKNTDFAKASLGKFSGAVVSGLDAVAEFDIGEFAEPIAANIYSGMHKTKPLAKGDKQEWAKVKNNFAGFVNDTGFSVYSRLSSAKQFAASNTENLFANTLTSVLGETASKINYTTNSFFADKLIPSIKSTALRSAQKVHNSVNEAVEGALSVFERYPKADDKPILTEEELEKAKTRLLAEEAKELAKKKAVAEGPKTIISQPVIERVVETERILAVSGITQDELNTAINQSENKMKAEMYSLTSANAGSIVNTYKVISQSNKIDDLGGVTIHDSTISASSFSGTTGGFSGLLTASDGLAASSATIDGDLTVDTNTLYVDSTNDRVGIGTTSPFATFSVAGDAVFDGDITASSITATSSVTFSGDVTLGDATTTDAVYFNSRIGTSLIPTVDNAIDIGSTSPWATWRSAYLGTSVGIAGTATSTGTQLTTSGAYLLDTQSALSLNTTNNQNILTGEGNVGISTSSPWARFSVAATSLGTTPLFSVSTSTATATSTVFHITSDGYIGVSTTTPTEQFSISELLYVGGTGTSTIENNLHIRDTLQVGTGSSYLTTDNLQTSFVNVTGASATSTFAGGLTIDSTDFVVDPDAGRVGIGTADPDSTLHVSGAAHITGALTLDTDLTVANGGTGASTFTDGGVLL